MITLTTASHTTTLRLDRPAKKNALTVDMYNQLAAGLTAAAADTDVHAVVITGSADCFTAGNDIGDFMRSGQATAPLDFLRVLATFDKPIIAAVAGVAIGIGTTLLLHCDLVIAAPSARFKTPFVALGLVPEAASSLLLPALIGERRAAQLLLFGEQIDAATALAWGLINELADDPYATAIAKAAALGPPGAVLATKALLRRPHRDAVLETMRREGEAFAARLRSPEAMAAFAAFMKR